MSDEDFKRQQVCYEQNFQQARSLNTQMNQVPAFAMTLTGGLWFAAGLHESLVLEIRFALLIFSGFCNLALILAALRIRDVFHSYLEKLKGFHENSYVSGTPIKPKMPKLNHYSMISIYGALMGLSSALSFLGAFGFYWPFSISVWWGVGLLTLILIVSLYFLLVREKAPKTERGDNPQESEAAHNGSVS